MSRGRRSAGEADVAAGLGKARGQSRDVLDAVEVVLLVALSDGFHDGGVGVDLQGDALLLSISQLATLSAVAVVVLLAAVDIVPGGGDDEDEDGNEHDGGFHF